MASTSSGTRYTDRELKAEARNAIRAYAKQRTPTRKAKTTGYAIVINGSNTHLIAYGQWESPTGPIGFQVHVAI